MFHVTGLFHATLVAWDLGRAERFYKEVLGIGRHATPSYFPDDVVFLDLGNTMVHIIRFGSALRRPDVGGTPSELAALDEAGFVERQKAIHLLRLHIAIEVDDLAAAYEAVRAAGRPILQEPTVRPDGLHCFYFADTEYNRVELVQH